MGPAAHRGVMAGVEDDLRAAFEPTSYDVDAVSVNRRQVRVTVRQADADAAALRAVVEEALGEEAILALDVSHASDDASDAVGTAVTVRLRG